MRWSVNYKVINKGWKGMYVEAEDGKEAIEKVKNKVWGACRFKVFKEEKKEEKI